MKTVAWDIDDTLNDLMGAWLRSPRPGRALAFRAVTANPPHGLLGITLKSYQASLDAFRLSERYDALPPAPQALAWFRSNGARFRHIAVTAVPLVAAHKSAAWLFRHFGRWIRTFHVVPTPRPRPAAPRYDSTKADFIRAIGGCDYFIDDSPANAEAVRATGARCLLAPRPWNGADGDLRAALAAVR